MEKQATYDFIQKSFVYNDERYNVVLTPELYAEEDSLDFTGNYTGILICENRGTYPFQLTPGEETKWEMIFLHPDSLNSGKQYLFSADLDEEEFPKASRIIIGLNDPGIIDELDRIINDDSNSIKGSVLSLVKDSHLN